MRVIAGSARRLVLKTVEGMDTRPTTDRIKETLFNMLQNELYGCSFLDLFAGSGAIGIEALSRGAKKAVFIDNGSRQTACIRENLKTTKLEEKGVVLSCDVFTGLMKLKAEGTPFDFIFMDPPYNHDLEKQVLDALKTLPIVTEDTVLIAEASLDTDFSWADEAGYEIIRNKEYKTNKHVFMKKKNGEVS